MVTVSQKSALPIVPTSVGWKRELQQTLRTPQAVSGALTLSATERLGLEAYAESPRGLPLAITPHMLTLMGDDETCAIRRQLIPRPSEWTGNASLLADPLGEVDREVVPGLVHRYPDRVLLLVTDRCAAYCRFCTRKRWVGQGPTTQAEQIAAALTYVAAHREVKEVILSGGDALMLDDERLDALLSDIRRIAHVEIIRIATRMPAFVPSRITPTLTDVLRAHHPVYILSHFNHPRELSGAGGAAVERLTHAGIPVLNQTVLLRGVNDDAVTLEELFRGLTRRLARPYYLHQCDLAEGTHAFRVPLDDAKALMASLRGRVSGISLPTLVLDVPGGHGKVPLYPDVIVAKSETAYTVRGSLGGEAEYPREPARATAER